jgi:tRNA threonylcarbamoyladenosine biosynthesis protein TsaE
MDQAIPDPAVFDHGCLATGPQRTRALGARIARCLAGGEILLLYGPLGAGKTCLVQGLCAALDVGDEVVSPTFTLVHRYTGRLTVYHLDFYRVEPGDSLADIGVEGILDEAATHGAVVVVEWPEPIAPLADRRVELLALPGAGADLRHWYWRGVPALPASWQDLTAGEDRPC